MSQLGLGLGLSNVSSLLRFSPLDLDPYLLFDTQSSMIGTLENPTLDLDPANPETLDVITATRAGVATYTDADGLIQSASPNTTRVDYTQGAELTPTKFQNIGYTDFTSGWAAQNGVTSEAGDEYENQPVRRVIYDGVTTGGIYQTIVNTVGGVSYTGSFYARKISGSNQIYIRHGFSASGNQTILPVTTEWQKFSVTILGASGGGNVYFGLIQFSAGDDVYEITQPQFEEGTTATTFVENTTGNPKFTGISATYAPRVPMILCEPSATNRISNSNSFSKGAVSRLGTNFEAPDKTNTAEGYGNIPNNVSDAILLSSSPASVSGNTQYSGSIFVKGIAGKTVKFFVKRSGNGNYVESPAQIITLTGEWQRITGMTITTSSNNTELTIYMLGLTTDTAADEIYIWGAQLEEGSVSTSAIPTSGSPVTRAADDLEITGSDFTDFFNSGGDGTFYAEFVPKEIETLNNIITGHGGGGGGLFLYSNYPTYANIRSYDGTSATTYGDANNNEINRASVSYNSSTFRGSLNGITEDSQPHNGTFSTKTHLRLGYNADSPISFKRVIYWPYSSENL